MSKMLALTGHRALQPDLSRDILLERLEELIAEGYDGFLCGMAQGFDLLALDVLVQLKQKYRLYLEACVPYVGQETRFPREERERYHELIAWCDRKTVLFDGYRTGCYLARDRYMVDCSDGVLAYLRAQTGGTAYTVQYAQKKGLPVYFL